MTVKLKSVRFSFLGPGPGFTCEIPDSLGLPYAVTVINCGRGAREFTYSPPQDAPAPAPSHFELIESKKSFEGFPVDVYRRPDGDLLGWAIIWHLVDGGVVATHVRGVEGRDSVDRVIDTISIVERAGSSPQLVPIGGARFEISLRPGFEERVLFQLPGADIGAHIDRTGEAPVGVEFVRPAVHIPELPDEAAVPGRPASRLVGRLLDESRLALVVFGPAAEAEQLADTIAVSVEAV